MPKYIVAVSESLISFDTVEEARKHAEKFKAQEQRPMVVYAVEAVDIVRPVKGLTNDDVPPPTGGTPIMLRKAA